MMKVEGWELDAINFEQIGNNESILTDVNEDENGNFKQDILSKKPKQNDKWVEE